jgi:hypothetical protein
MNDFWAEQAKDRAEHDAKYPNHREDEIFTCINCYEMDIAKVERERIIELLEAERRQCEKAGLFANGYEIRQKLQTLFIGLESAIALIKGETK